jgi:hypothetical protein
MRPVTAEEAARWQQLAEEYGCTDEDGNIAMGRFRVKRVDGNTIALQFITPIVAGLHTDELEEKQPPIMFDRTANGEIIIPGRWWQHMFEKLSETDYDEDIRRTAFSVAHGAVRFHDSHVPSDVETIAFLAPNANGQLVLHEALPPGGTIHMKLNPISR